MGEIGDARQISEAIRDGPQSSTDFKVYLTDILRLLKAVHKYLLTNREHSFANLDEIRGYLTTIYEILELYLPENAPIDIAPKRWLVFKKEVSEKLLKNKFNHLVSALDLYSTLVSQKESRMLREPKTLKHVDDDESIVLTRKTQFFDKYKEFIDIFDRALRNLK